MKIDFRKFNIPPVRIERQHTKQIDTGKAFEIRWQRMNNRIRGLA